ncbi:MAG: outer membrane beta-barrel protein [Proteobacteria bacterium]|nr:outer membrane beta-barrel protein [Pseudomonadota bacterium]MCL2309519.1 outer membrane beta-barrel protein [Pseudomonadota bacterium]
MKMKVLASAFAVAALALGVVGVAQAADANKFVVKLGLADVVPKSDNGTLSNGLLKTDVGNSVRPSITFEYLITPNIGVEVLGAWPFRNDIKLNGVKSGRVDVLPPTVSLQYHFLPEKVVSPFVGVGVNYTFMYHEKTLGPIRGNKLDIENSWGVAAHGGVDFNFNKNWLMTLDARWIRMRNDVKVNGNKVGKVNIDPMVWGIAVGYRF